MRLNKYIAHHSSYSRREADRAIEAGYVRVDGVVVTDLSTQVDEHHSEVYVSGKKVTPSDKYTVIVYNKPKGEIVSKKDPEGRRTIYDTLESKYKHYIPVGRLDFATEGLLLLTDASKVATALMESDLERIYKVKIKGAITPQMESAMLEGLELKDATQGAHAKSKITSMTFAPFIGYKIHKNAPNYSTLKIAISEGQNREIRRFFAHFGTDVMDLKRVSYGDIELNALPTGKTRFLTRSEYAKLADFLKDTERKAKEDKKGVSHPELSHAKNDEEPKRVPTHKKPSAQKPKTDRTKAPKRFEPIKKEGRSNPSKKRSPK
ncbi:MAG: rRNA pseudouridine synthase [Epsilonproteobacteria bacterium]|nr:rRNA pseudouridine synthase [Campylobacterota bacterium]